MLVRPLSDTAHAQITFKVAATFQASPGVCVITMLEKSKLGDMPPNPPGSASVFGIEFCCVSVSSPGSVTSLAGAAALPDAPLAGVPLPAGASSTRFAAGSGVTIG